MFIPLMKYLMKLKKYWKNKIGGSDARKIWNRIVWKGKRRFKEIVTYIKKNLNEPTIARKYAQLINERIRTLKYIPQRYMIIEDNEIKHLNIRRLLIKNYIAFYRIDESKRIVRIERILYGASNWMSNL